MYDLEAKWLVTATRILLLGGEMHEFSFGLFNSDTKSIKCPRQFNVVILKDFDIAFQSRASC